MRNVKRFPLPWRGLGRGIEEMGLIPAAKGIHLRVGFVLFNIEGSRGT
jgi:hypothetical protein